MYAALNKNVLRRRLNVKKVVMWQMFIPGLWSSDRERPGAEDGSWTPYVEVASLHWSKMRTAKIKDKLETLNSKLYARCPVLYASTHKVLFQAISFHDYLRYPKMWNVQSLLTHPNLYECCMFGQNLSYYFSTYHVNVWGACAWTHGQIKEWVKNFMMSPVTLHGTEA